MKTELKVIADFYDFMLWLIRHTEKFPRHHRYSLGMGAYVHYCDDFILLHDDRALLKDALGLVQERLALCRLRVHECRAFVSPVRAGLTFVGYRMWPTHRIIRKDNIRRFRRRVCWMRKAYAMGAINWEDIKPRLASWIGHARHADSARLLRRLSREWTFSRGGANRGACSSRRIVEQQREQPALCESQQQQPRQPEQQQRVPFGPALSVARRHQARNRTVYGLRERGFVSPGAAPEPVSTRLRRAGRIHVVRPGGSGRTCAEGPVRLLTLNARTIPDWMNLERYSDV